MATRVNALTDKELDRATDDALGRAQTRGPGATLDPPATRDNAPLAWDLTRFVIWKDALTSDRARIRVAAKALKYTGE